ncbi:MAG TPA: DUF169 domain-containing protein [Vicinamibacterales bacterium]|jgi:uncharacterized protein (DUF169 family)
MSSAQSVQDLLGLRTPPIAIGFLDTPPSGLQPWQGGAVPAGCSFWERAAAGESFYTVPSDHFNCAVGCHTHHIPLPAERRSELTTGAQMMVDAGYLRPSDVLSIPTLPRTPAVVAYAPVGQAAFHPDVVLLTVTPAQGMLIYEAALRLGDGSSQMVSALGRPACAVLPFVQGGSQAALSLGCKGNRVYTGLPDDQMYFAIPAAQWERFEEIVRTIVQANGAMGAYYEAKAT